MNEELAIELVKEIGGGKTKFFECNVLETESVSAAVEGAVKWAKETGKGIGGVVAAAGVSTPAKVSFSWFLWKRDGTSSEVTAIWEERFRDWVTCHGLSEVLPQHSDRRKIVQQTLHFISESLLYKLLQLTSPRSSTEISNPSASTISIS
jgi:hypothetical protein